MGSSLVDYATAPTKVVVAKRRPQIAVGAAKQTHGVGVKKNQAAKRRQQKAGEGVSSTAILSAVAALRLKVTYILDLRVCTRSYMLPSLRDYAGDRGNGLSLRSNRLLQKP